MASRDSRVPNSQKQKGAASRPRTPPPSVMLVRRPPPRPAFCRSSSRSEETRSELVMTGPPLSVARSDSHRCRPAYVVMCAVAGRRYRAAGLPSKSECFKDSKPGLPRDVKQISTNGINCLPKQITFVDRASLAQAVQLLCCRAVGRILIRGVCVGARHRHHP